MEEKRILVCGHRGDMTYHPENTMEAFRAAVGYGVDMIETDVHMTRDGVLVLRHDIVIPEIGRVCDHDYDELRKAKPDLPTLEEFLELMLRHPDLALNLEFKDVPAAPAAEGIDKGVSSMSEDFAFSCQDKALAMLKEAGITGRTWLNSFSGALVERAYLKEGKRFRYHGFYPWFIMGELTVDPASYVDLVCMQHRCQTADGSVVKYEDPLCPEDWWRTVLAGGMTPLAAPSLTSYENFDKALSFGAGAINANDPKGMLAHLKELGMR